MAAISAYLCISGREFAYFPVFWHVLYILGQASKIEMAASPAGSENPIFRHLTRLKMRHPVGQTNRSTNTRYAGHHHTATNTTQFVIAPIPT